MKKIFYLLFVAVLGFGMVACDKDDPKPRNNGEYGPGGGGNDQPGGDQPGGDQPGDSDLDVKFTADQFWCGYYGDYLGLGTNMYLVEINNGTIDDAGYLTSTGYAITLAVNGPMPEKGKTITLPVGTYRTDLGQTDNFKILNEDYGFFLSFVEMMYAGETTSYTDFIKDGTMKITNNGNNKFTVACDLDMYYIDEEGNEVADGNIKGTYVGKIEVQDYTEGGGEETPLYEPLPFDVDLGNVDVCTGSFYKFTKSGLGNYYISLMDVDVDWEKEEFKGPGYIMTLDLYTDYSDEPDFNMLNGNFTFAKDGEYEEWTFMEGTVVEKDGEPTWNGTYLDEIAELEDEDGKYFGYDRSSMVTGGTIEANSDGTNVTLKLNLTTENGHKITGTYSGKPEIQVPEQNEINAIQAKKVKSVNDIIRPFSKYERLGRIQAKKAKSLARRTPRKLGKVTRNYTRR